MFDMVCMMKLAVICDSSVPLGQSMATGCTNGETSVWIHRHSFAR